MVYLNRIYTKTGDQGQTSLGDGSRVSKTDPRIVAYGCVDELNAVIGVALTTGGVCEPTASRLRGVQNALFDVGADLCVPESPTPTKTPPLRVTEKQVTGLETWIDEVTAALDPLT